MRVLGFFLLGYEFWCGGVNRLHSAIFGDRFTRQDDRLISSGRTKLFASGARRFRSDTRLFNSLGGTFRLLLWSLLDLLLGLLVGLTMAATTTAATSTPAPDAFTLLLAAAHFAFGCSLLFAFCFVVEFFFCRFCRVDSCALGVFGLPVHLFSFFGQRFFSFY